MKTPQQIKKEVEKDENRVGYLLIGYILAILEFVLIKLWEFYLK